MDLAQTARVVIDVEAELLAAYPSLTRRLALVLRDAAAASLLVAAAGIGVGSMARPSTAFIGSGNA